jgi:hypothetical protein
MRMSANSRKRMVIGFIELILIGIVLILLLSDNRSATVPSDVPTTPSQQLDEGPASEVPRVSVSGAYTAYTTKQAVFVDVRSTDQYKASHVTGALSIPLNELDSRLNELDKAQWIITYCT